MAFQRVKKPFNQISHKVRSDALCFQLDRYCMHKGEAVAVFHLNDPESVMKDYVYDDGLIYLNAGTMKLISQLLKNADVSEKLQTYLEGTRIDLEQRGRLPIPIIACFRAPSPELRPPLEAGLAQDMKIIGNVFNNAMHREL